jgi:hypothetical protein
MDVDQDTNDGRHLVMKLGDVALTVGTPIMHDHGLRIAIAVGADTYFETEIGFNVGSCSMPVTDTEPHALAKIRPRV